MTKISTQTETPAETEETILTIPLAKVCALVAKAHEFDAKDPATEDDLRPVVWIVRGPDSRRRLHDSPVVSVTGRRTGHRCRRWP
jgi:hypothetical protein